MLIKSSRSLFRICDAKYNLEKREQSHFKDETFFGDMGFNLCGVVVNRKLFRFIGSLDQYSQWCEYHQQQFCLLHLWCQAPGDDCCSHRKNYPCRLLSILNILYPSKIVSVCVCFVHGVVRQSLVWHHQML